MSHFYHQSINKRTIQINAKTLTYAWNLGGKTGPFEVTTDQSG